MNLKKLFILVLLVSNYSGNAQNNEKKIKAEFIKFNDLIVNSKFESAMDYVYPEVYNVISKSSIVKSIKEIYSSPDFEFKVKNLKITNVETPTKINKKYYTVVSYSNEVNIKLYDEPNETEEDKKLMLKIVEIALNKSFVSDNVIYNSQTEKFKIIRFMRAFAILENKNSNWKFLIIEKQLKSIYEKFLPIEMIKKL